MLVFSYFSNQENLVPTQQTQCEPVPPAHHAGLMLEIDLQREKHEYLRLELKTSYITDRFLSSAPQAQLSHVTH